jgi:hypothetical protein
VRKNKGKGRTSSLDDDEEEHKGHGNARILIGTPSPISLIKVLARIYNLGSFFEQGAIFWWTTMESLLSPSGAEKKCWLPYILDL